MQKMVPLLSLQAPWPATSLLPSLQSGIMTSTWHNVNALTLSFTFDDNCGWVWISTRSCCQVLTTQTKFRSEQNL
jgi:hypothetical protein